MDLAYSLWSILKDGQYFPSSRRVQGPEDDIDLHRGASSHTILVCLSSISAIFLASSSARPRYFAKTFCQPSDFGNSRRNCCVKSRRIISSASLLSTLVLPVRIL